MSKTKVLLLPGTLCTPAVFRHQEDVFRRHFIPVEPVSFCQERHVDEMAQTAVAHIPQGEPSVIIGFSMGGMVALAMQRLYPDRVAGIALVNSNSHTDDPVRQARRLEHLLSGRKYGLEFVFQKHYLPRYLHRQNEAHQKLITEMACEMGLDRFEAQIQALSSRPDATDTLRALNCPTLILGSDNDPLCPPSEQKRMHQLVKKSELVLLENCGHFSILEQADLVSDILVRWYLGQHMDDCNPLRPG